MLTFRDYSSYDEYRQHQGSKLDKKISKRVARFIDRKIMKQIKNSFKQRFVPIIKYIPKGSKIICLGARLGMEVQAFRELGFPDAIGVDLNPGLNQNILNPLVIKADFNNINVKDETFDIVYTNSIDHCFNLVLFNREVFRILNQTGRLILDIPHIGHTKMKISEQCRRDGVKSAHKYESCSYDNINDIKESLINFNWVLNFNGVHERIVAICDKKVRRKK